MAKITITLQDTENGHVKIDCSPDMEQLVKIAKAHGCTPAEGYAVRALGKMVQDSIKATAEEMAITLPPGATNH